MKSYKHQEEIVDLSKTMPNLALFWDCGTGKSKGLIDIIRHKYNTNKGVMPTLILSPLVTLFNWKNEFKIWSKVPSEKICVIDCSGKKRITKITRQLEKDRNCIVVVNYEALQNDEFYNLLLSWRPEIVVADEIHLLKNHKSKRAKKAVSIADKAKYRYGLTGTPILNSITDVFFQYRFLDGGKTFGKSFWVFQDKYMYDENAAWKSRPGYFPKMSPRPEKFDELQEKMYKIASRVRKEECLDLPPLVRMTKPVDLSKEQARMYKQMQQEFITFVKDQQDACKSKAVVANLALTKALRLQQIVSGFVMTEEGKEIEIEDNPRLKLTEEIVQSLIPEHKVIIWCSFKNNYAQLGRMLKRLKIGHVFITGEMSLAQKQEAMNDFRTDKGVRVVVANRRAGGIGINLVEASYSIIFSRNFSLGEEKQSEARNHRGGSQVHKRITKIDLVARGTIDELVADALNNKQKLSTRIIDWAMEEA